MTEQIALAKEIDDIYGYIKSDLARDSEGLMEELMMRCSWLARSAEIEADAQFYLNKKRGEVAEKYIGTEESWNIVKQLIESQTGNEQRMLKQAERLNATLTHQIDAIRTLLSFQKQELANAKGQ